MAAVLLPLSRPVTEPAKPKWPPVEDDCALYRDYSEESRVLVVSFSGLKPNPRAVPGFSLRRHLHGTADQETVSS